MMKSTGLTLCGLFCLILIFLSLSDQSKAQSSLNYSITNIVTGSLGSDKNGNTVNTSVAGNLLLNNISNYNSTLQQIGFDFFFMGKPYTHFIIGSNGQLGLGIAGSPLYMLSNLEANDLTRTITYPPLTANSAAVLAPFWDKMYTAYSGATAKTIVAGNYPNRCRIIEWNNVINAFGYTGSPTALFQVRLYENSGVIEYVYGNMSICASSTTVMASLGFTAGTGDNQFLASQNLSTFAFTAAASAEPATQSLVNTAVAGDISGLHSTAEGSRRLIRFTPPVLSGTGYTNYRLSEISATTATLQWTDNYTNELNYVVMRSTDNINFSFIRSLPPNTNIYIDSNLTLGTTYYWKLYAISEGYSASSNSVVSGTTACSMNGTYTLGPGGNFTSLKTAAESLKARGVSGHVAIEILNGYNSATETFPITFPKTGTIPCLGNNKITIRPAAGSSNIEIAGANDAGILILDSVRYLIIDGRPGGIGTSGQLTVKNNNAASAIRMINSSLNKIQFVKAAGGISGLSSVDGVISFLGSKASGSDSNLVYNCEIFSAGTPANARPVLFYSSAQSGRENNNDTILNCRFYDFSKHAINIDPYNIDWYLGGNRFNNTASITYNQEVSVVRIRTPHSGCYHRISQNYFGGMAPDRMNINYSQRFYFIDITGAAEISDNGFSRMNFINSTNQPSPEIRFISMDSGYYYNFLASRIAGNNIGSDYIADSLHFYQGFPDNPLQVTGIYTEQQRALITENRLDHIRCRSNSGGISFFGIQSFSGYDDISNNIIGSAEIRNSIVNSSNVSSAGISGIQVNKITNNTITNWNTSAQTGNTELIGIDHSYLPFDSISGNKVFRLNNNMSDVNGYASLYGIRVSQSGNSGGPAYAVHNNLVHSLCNNAAAGIGTFAGIASMYADVSIERNFIHSLSTNSPNSCNIYGIYIPDKYSRLANNMVSLGYDTTGNSITGGNIMIIGVSGGHVMTHNSIYIGGMMVTDGFLGSTCYSFLGNALPSVSYNNIFQNSRSNALTSSSSRHKCVSIDIAYSFNNNLYYHDGTGGIIGTWGGFNNYETLSQWKTGSGIDVNSIFGNPKFRKASSGADSMDLHLDYSSPAEGAGGTANTLATDFDNQTRSSLSPVDIGADAGNYLNCPLADAGPDATVFEGGSVQLGSPAALPVSYSWTGPGGFTSTLPNPVVSPTSTSQYSLTIQDGSCVSTDIVTVNVMTLSPLYLCPGATSAVTMDAGVTGNVYQWQASADSGATYGNINNNTYYSGTNTQTLSLTGLPSTLYGYKYRCRADSTYGPPRMIQFRNYWTGAVNSNWSEPGNWSCGSLPDGGTDVYIYSGQVILNTNGTCRTINLSTGVNFAVQSGYTLTVTH